MTRLQEVAREFSIADEALRKALLRAERAERIIKQKNSLMGVRTPRKLEMIGHNGYLEIHSLPLGW